MKALMKVAAEKKSILGGLAKKWNETIGKPKKGKRSLFELTSKAERQRHFGGDHW